MTSIEDRVQRLLALDERLLVAAELAVEEAIKMLSDARTPSAAKSAVINTALRSNGLMDGRKQIGETKEPHEMTADELQQQIARLRREAADRARPIIDAVPVQIETAKKGVFG